MIKKKLGIYARQSVDTGKGGSIEDQILKGKLKAKELNLEYIEYIDRGKTAYADNFENRPGFKRLLDDIVDEKICAVFVYDNSRLARHSDANYQIKRIFKRYDILVHSEIEGTTDFTDTISEMLSDIRAAFNMKFVEDTSAKIRSVLMNNAEKGRAHTGAIKPFGYTQDDKNMLIVDEEEAVVVRDIFNLAASGIGSYTIAKLLNENGVKTKTHRLVLQKSLGQTPVSSFNPANGNPPKEWVGNVVLNILKNPIYKGLRSYKEKQIECPKIVDELIWEQAQNQIKKNRHAPGISKHKYLLKHLVICGRCGSNFCGRTRLSKKDHFYYCSSRVKSTKKCGIRSINIDTLENLIWMTVCDSDIFLSKARENVSRLADPEIIETLIQEKSQLEKKIIALKKARQNILTLISNSHIEMDEAKHHLELNKNKNDEYTRSLNEISLKLADQQGIVNTLNYTEQFLKDWKNLAFTGDFDLKYTLVRLLINQIVVHFDDAEELYTIEINGKLPKPYDLRRLKINSRGVLIENTDLSDDSSEEPTSGKSRSSKKSQKQTNGQVGSAGLNLTSISDTTTSEMVWCGLR